MDYDEPLFRGYINAAEQARHILQALRGDRMLPQILQDFVALGDDQSS